VEALVRHGGTGFQRRGSFLKENLRAVPEECVSGEEAVCVGVGGWEGEGRMYGPGWQPSQALCFEKCGRMCSGVVPPSEA
jgi:exo-beta-1,3-glucanase (GH17 family)